MQTWNSAISGNNINIEYGSVKAIIGISSKIIFPPRLVTTLYGRADEFTRAIQEIEAGKPVTLHGMAGMGKSALASAIAWSVMDKYSNGVLWIDGGYNAIDSLCDTVGQQLEDDQMPRLASTAKPARVRYLLGANNVLVVLDDCWDPDIAREFAQTCIPAGNSLIVTCREKIARLGTLIEVQSLEYRAGIDLFCDSAGISALKSDSAITELVQLLGGHPQGLVIAGALCLEDELSAGELLKMLGPAEERAKMLKLGKDASNNVWATFDLSYQRLKPEEQIIFKTFGGAWSKSATAELLSYIVFSDLETIEFALRGLVKRALARTEEMANGRKRYIVHDLIHAYTQGLIKETGQTIEEIKYQWLSAIDKYTEKYKNDTNECHYALEAELGNIIGAANWGAEHSQNSAVNKLAHIMCSSSGFLYRRGYYTLAVALSRLAIVAALTLGEKKDEGIHRGNLGYAYALLSDYPSAISCYQEALALAKTINDKSSESKWFGLIAFAYDNIGDYRKAIENYQAALEIDKAIGNEIGEGRWLGSLAGTYRTLGDGEKASELYSQAIDKARKLGDRANECVHLSNLGNAYRTWGKYSEAIQYYDQALVIALEIGDRATQARCLVNSGRLFSRLGKPVEGLEKCKKALDIFMDIGFKSGEAYAHGYIGEVLRANGNKEEAYQETQKALDLHREVGVRNGQGDWLHNLGIWSLEDDKEQEGITYLKEALLIRQELGIAKVNETLMALKQVDVKVV